MAKPDACARAREAIPDWAESAGWKVEENPDGGAAWLALHLGTCAECAAEARLVARLRAARPEVPAGLDARILSGLRTPRTDARTPGLPAPRVLRRWWWAGVGPAMAAGISALFLFRTGGWIGPSPSPEGLPPEHPEEIGVETVWSPDSGIGAFFSAEPVLALDDLSDGELELLLKELDS